MSVALSLPPSEGLKVTLTAQVPFGTIVWLLQPSDAIMKLGAPVPETVTAPAAKVRLAVPVLVTVTLCGVLVVPSS